MPKQSDSPPIPEPTHKLYKTWPGIAYLEGRTDEVPEPIEGPLSDLVLSTEAYCIIRVRRDDDFARSHQQGMWESHQQISLVARDAAVNYIDIGPQRWHGVTFLRATEATVHGSDATWFRINHDDAEGKIIRPMEYTEAYPRFSEVDKFGHGDSYFFDGTFSDFMEALQAEGFAIADA